MNDSFYFGHGKLVLCVVDLLLAMSLLCAKINEFREFLFSTNFSCVLFTSKCKSRQPVDQSDKKLSIGDFTL